MVPLMVYIVRMGRSDKEPWVAFRNIVCRVIPVESRIRMCSGRMIVYHIEEYGHASLVAGIDECLVIITGSIDLVHGEICMGSISPAVIAVELLHRHKLNHVHSKLIEIVEIPHRSLEVSFAICIIRKVAQKKFVDDKVIIVFYLIISDFPVIFRTVYLE